MLWPLLTVSCVLRAVALTAYFVCQYCVLNFVRKLSHLRPLWFANVSNSILWFTFVKACWRALGAAFGKTLTFKTTIKGANMLMSTAVGDLWMPTIALLGSLASFGESWHLQARAVLLLCSQASIQQYTGVCVRCQLIAAVVVLLVAC